MLHNGSCNTFTTYSAYSGDIRVSNLCLRNGANVPHKGLIGSCEGSYHASKLCSLRSQLDILQSKLCSLRSQLSGYLVNSSELICYSLFTITVCSR